MVKVELRNFEIRKTKRHNIYMYACLTFLFQMVLVFEVMYELGHNCQYSYTFIQTASTMIIFARFICGSILHLSLLDEMDAGLEMMKYSLNHPYLFSFYPTAFSIGFMQFMSSFLVELVNMVVIVTQSDVINITFDFIALAIIAEFDNYVYESLKNESFKELIEPEFSEKILKIRHTTSVKAKETEHSTVKDEDGEYRPLKITFKSRTIINKLLFGLYKVIRAIYVSCVFYFLPFLTILASTIPCILYRVAAANQPTCNNTA